MIRFARLSPVLFLSLLLLGAGTAPNGGAGSAKPRRRRAHAAPTPDPLPLPAGLRIPRYHPGTVPFSDGETLIYQASWMGVPAAQARITIHHDHKDPPLWAGEMWITSSKIVDIAYRMRDYVREDFARESLEPEKMHLIQHERSRYDVWDVAFNHEAHLVTSSERDTRGRIKTRHFSGGEPFGPFSGAMMALSQPLAVGERLTFDVFSGGNRYVFAFDVKARERITTPLGTFDTLRIEPSVLWLSKGEFRNQARASTIWVTADNHLPVRIESQVFIGFVRADLIQTSGGSVPTGVTARGPAAQRMTAPDPPAPVAPADPLELPHR